MNKSSKRKVDLRIACIGYINRYEIKIHHLTQSLCCSSCKTCVKSESEFQVTAETIRRMYIYSIHFFFSSHRLDSPQSIEERFYFTF